MISNGRWDEIFDVVVVGSGAGALTSAVLAADAGAKVLVVEKDDYVGGTTAVSGGDMWIPNNHHIADQDSREDALAYIRRLSDGREADPGLQDVYVDVAPEALLWLEAHTGYRSEPHYRLHDYYSVIPGRIEGCKPFSRTCSPMPYPAGRELGETWAGLINKGPWVPPVEASFNEQRCGEPSPEVLAKREKEIWRAKGGGLIAPLLKAAFDRGAEVRLSSPAVELIADGATRGVVGIVVDGKGGRKTVGARRGVVLACGGFEWNAEMVKTFIGYEVKPLSPWTNTGDGHRMAMEAGAKLGSMTGYFGYGVQYDPYEKGRDGGPLPQMMMGLGPGSIIVNQHGKRFMHGGYTYNDFSHPFGAFDQRNPGFTNKAPAWCVFGSAHIEAGGVMGAKPGIEMNLSGHKNENAPEWLVFADSIAALAEKIGVDAQALEATIARYNAGAETGEDPEFGDASQTHSLTGPNTTDIQPVLGPTYGAIQQWPGTIGTNGGLRINENAQVLGERVPIIDGLYSAGNTAASVLGQVYPGGGSCIGPSMVMGFLAGRHLGRQPDREIGAV